MNPKTTLVLAVVLVVVVGLIWLAGGDKPAEQVPPKAPTQLLEETPLIAAEDLGEVVKIVCRHGEEPEWAFERVSESGAGGQPEWKMTAPMEAAATAWQVNGIARRIQQLNYKVRFSTEGAGAVTAAQAGLEPPASTVVLSDEKGRSVTVQVGRKPADDQTYVRLGGQGDIYVVSASLDTLLKKKAIEYRDQQICKFDKQHAKRLEITDYPEGGEPMSYVLVRSETGWTFEQPVKAATVADKIDQALSTLAALRVTNWVEAEAADLAKFGLQDQGLLVKVTVQEPVEPPEEEADDEESADSPDNENTAADQAESEDEAEEPAPEPVVRELAVRVSRRSPLGESTSVYVCPDGEQAVGTLTKTLADRLTPDLAEWREMRVTRAAVTTADRIDLTTPEGEASFTREAGKWIDAATGDKVDETAVTELLSQLGSLKAQNYVELGAADQTDFGLDAPQVTIRLNVPGQPEAERIVVGGFTDAERRRMVYVRHNEAEQVAKVRVADVDKLTRDPSEYRDRTVFDLEPDRIQRVAITRQDALTGGPFAFALGRTDDRLAIVEPVAAETSDEQVKQLTAALAALKATTVMPPASAAEYGLDSPTVTCEFTYRPPEITRYVETEEPPEEEGTTATQPALRAETYQPPDEVYAIVVAKHQGQVYVKREDRPTVYQVPERILHLLDAEYHDPAILRFEESQVVGIRVTNPDGTAHEFAKVDDQWTYRPEPDLPIDPNRVQDLLLRIKDLKSERFVAYGVENLADYGLDQPQASVTVRLDDENERTLLVAAEVCPADPSERCYATVAGSGEVFLVDRDAIERFAVDLAEFETP